MLELTLRGQVKRYARSLDWPDGAAKDAAEIAVEVAGSNWPIFNGEQFQQVVREACRSDGEGWAAAAIGEAMP